MRTQQECHGQAVTSCFFDSLAWDVDSDLFTDICVEETAPAATGTGDRTFTGPGELILHLCRISAYEMSWEGMCALTVGRLEARVGVYLNGELSRRWERSRGDVVYLPCLVALFRKVQLL